MFINDTDIKKFGAKVQRKVISHTPSIKSMKWLSSSSSLPIEEGEQRDLKPLDIRLLFEGKDREEIHNNYSNFMSKINSCDIRFKDLSHNFKSFLVSEVPEESGIDEWLFVDLNFLVYEYGGEISKSFNNVLSFTIDNIGNQTTPCIVEITPISDIIDITLEGLDDDPIIIKNLKANKKVILDGVQGLVTVDGVNKYGDTDMWDFPRLKPGANVIKISRNSCDINIKYNPRFI